MKYLFRTRDIASTAGMALHPRRSKLDNGEAGQWKGVFGVGRYPGSYSNATTPLLKGTAEMSSNFCCSPGAKNGFPWPTAMG